MADKRRLAELGMPTELAKEVAKQIDGGITEKPEITALTAIATADGSDPATTQALANACKAKINAIIAALQA